MPAVWNIPSSGIRPREVSIYRFLKDARRPVRVVEVRLFRKDPLFGRRPVYTRRWEPGKALAATAKGDFEIHRRQRTDVLPIFRPWDRRIVGRVAGLPNREDQPPLHGRTMNPCDEIVEE
jgi:hypothetical protein